MIAHRQRQVEGIVGAVLGLVLLAACCVIGPLFMVLVSHLW